MSYNIVSYNKPMLIISPLSAKTIQERLVEALNIKANQAGIVDKAHEENQFRFSAPPFRWSWNGFDLFNTVSKVQIQFTKPNALIQLEIRFVYTELFLTALALSSTIVIAALSGLTYWSIILGLLIWGTYLTISLYNMSRFTSWVEKQVKITELHALEQAGDRQYSAKAETKHEVYSNV